MEHLELVRNLGQNTWMNCVFKMPHMVQAKEPSSNMHQIITAKSSKCIIISLCINTNYFEIIIKLGFLKFRCMCSSCAFKFCFDKWPIALLIEDF